MNRKEKIKERKLALRNEVRESEQKVLLELRKTRDHAVDLSENALLVAGSVMMGFILVQVVHGRKRPAKISHKKTGQLSLAGFSVRNRIYKRFLQYLTTFILSIARRKLVDFLLEGEYDETDHTEGSLQEQG